VAVTTSLRSASAEGRTRRRRRSPGPATITKEQATWR
jgi:hypothetical protein